MDRRCGPARHSNPCSADRSRPPTGSFRAFMHVARDGLSGHPHPPSGLRPFTSSPRSAPSLRPRGARGCGSGTSTSHARSPLRDLTRRELELLPAAAPDSATAAGASYRTLGACRHVLARSMLSLAPPCPSEELAAEPFTVRGRDAAGNHFERRRPSGDCRLASATRLGPRLHH